MKRTVTLWTALLLGIPMACFLYLNTTGISVGMNDPADVFDGLWNFSMLMLRVASVTVFDVWWWVVALAWFVAFRLHRRATPSSTIRRRMAACQSS